MWSFNLQSALKIISCIYYWIYLYIFSLKESKPKVLLTQWQVTDFAQISCLSQYSSSWGNILVNVFHRCGAVILVNYCWEQRKKKRFSRQVEEMVKVPFKSQQVPEKAVVDSSTTKSNILKYFLPLLPQWKGGKATCTLPKQVWLSSKGNLWGAEDPI